MKPTSRLTIPPKRSQVEFDEWDPARRIRLGRRTIDDITTGRAIAKSAVADYMENTFDGNERRFFSSTRECYSFESFYIMQLWGAEAAFEEDYDFDDPRWHRQEEAKDWLLKEQQRPHFDMWGKSWLLFNQCVADFGS
jgi:hypothetical protein